MSKNILGLDLGTNSIGWALVEIDHQNKTVKILGLGSRILPMDAQEIGDFENSGKIISAAAQRTEKRGARRLNERYLLRRDRLHLVLNLLDTLPAHYKLDIDFTNAKGEKCGQFKTNSEPKLAYYPKIQGSKSEFIFMDAYSEMLKNISHKNTKNKKGYRIPYDWTLYYLRQKALSEKISLEEFAWVLLSYNQKRGYEKTEIIDKSEREGELIEELDLKVINVISKQDKQNRQYFEVYLDGNDQFKYDEYSEVQMTFPGDLKEIIKVSIVDEHGGIDDKNTIFSIVDIYPLVIQKIDYQKSDGKHNYTLTYQTGWQELKQPKNYTFRYKNAINKSYDYIVRTTYDYQGKIKTQQGKERTFKEPDFSDNSSDWTLLKKKTEKETLKFNSEKGLKNEDGSIQKFISPNIYSVLKNDAVTGQWTKIIGGMFQVVDRDFYREELNQIIKTQKKFHNKLNDQKIIENCVKTLYPKNEIHAKALLENKDTIQHLLVEDILLYQRPLKSKKSEIANCKYEVQYWKDAIDKDGSPINIVDIATGEIFPKKEPVYIKVVSVSHPYYQEFRIWDKIHNLRLIQLEKEVNGKTLTNQDVTSEYFKSNIEYQALYDELNSRKSLSQLQFFDFCKKTFKLPYNKKEPNFVWNFTEDDEIKGNETRVSFAFRFKRSGFSQYADFLTQEKELALWHYLYSVSYLERTKDNYKSLRTFFDNYFKGFEISDEIKERIIIDFAKYPTFKSQYGAYSEKALKKLIPLIHLGVNNNKYNWIQESWYKKWQESLDTRKQEILQKLKNIDFNAEVVDYSEVVNTNVNFIKGELPFPKGLFNVFKDFSQPDNFNHLNLTQASYLVYGRHSELAQAKYWTSPDDIRKQLHLELKQHSLNNPVAEKVLLEMMQVVADIWDYYGQGEKEFFSRIHIEVGREFKKSAKEKESETKRMSESRSQNKRLRQILEDFLSNNTYNANHGNMDHFERLKIIEEGAEHTKNNDKDFFKDKEYNKKEIEEILKKQKISSTDFEKYKLWIEQGYRSPYSGQMIKLTDLFNGSKYNIDHIFPQASVTNNSLSNKVVVEVELNQLKSDRTARAFIEIQNGQAHLGIPVCSEDDYVNIVKTQFSGTKRYILLSKEIPKGFISSQLNTSRHIARKAMELLSHIVREPGEVEFRSKNVLPVTGAITSELKKAWKLEHVWTELVAPRFERLNELTQSNLFGSWQTAKSGQKYFDCNLDETIREQNKSYDIKRIDHRHHALDALIVALCTEDHVNYLSNINADAKSDNYGKQKQIEKYRETLKRKIKFSKPKKENPNEKDWFYLFPGELRKPNAENSERISVLEMSYWYKNQDTFHGDFKKMVLSALQNTLVTFKQNLRVINKSANFYNNTPNKKEFIKQNTENGQNVNWAIRRSLGKGTFYSKIDVGERENKLLITNSYFFYHNTDAIASPELRKQIQEIRNTSRSESEFKSKLKKDFKNTSVKCIVFKIASRFGSELNTTFDSKKIQTISDISGQTKAILLNQLKQFDSVELPFIEAISYYEYLIEKQEFEAIVQDSENDFGSIYDLINYLKNNDYKYKKSNYAALNIFIDKVIDRDFRNEEQFKNKIQEHPEFAFTPEAIDEMNKPENIKKLNLGKIHKPITKVTTYTGFGNQRQVGDGLESVKSRQYVVNDAGSNLYLGVYERIYQNDKRETITERKFKDIGLIELIEVLKQNEGNRHNPLPAQFIDDKLNEFKRLFTLSPLDLVYVPADDEIENPSKVDFNNLSNDQINRIYKYVDGSEEIANFVPYPVSSPIWRFHGKKNKEIYQILNKEDKITISDNKLIQNEFGLGSQQNKNQNMIDGKTQIKKICWKLSVDKLGNISKALII